MRIRPTKTMLVTNIHFLENNLGKRDLVSKPASTLKVHLLEPRKELVDPTDTMFYVPMHVINPKRLCSIGIEVLEGLAATKSVHKVSSGTLSSKTTVSGKIVLIVTSPVLVPQCNVRFSETTIEVSETLIYFDPKDSVTILI